MNDGFDVNGILIALEDVLKCNGREIPLHEPLFRGREWEYVKECLDSGWVSSAGKYVNKFEEMLAEYTGVKHAVAVVNGTAALHISLKLVGVECGDEVVIPAMTFVATANAVSYCGAIPHFADISTYSLGIDYEKLDNYLKKITYKSNEKCYNRKTKRPIKAVIAMHSFGHPVDVDPLMEVCKRYRLELIEDAAQALGSFYKNRHMGCFGRLSTLSFNGNKIVTTGGGGAILTNDSSLAACAKHISTTAKVPHEWAFMHDQLGYNYRMPNINAALGCAQLEQIEDFIRKKRNLAQKYYKAFKDLKGISFFVEPDYAASNYWLNTLIINEEYKCARDTILEAANKKGIHMRPSWVLMNKLPMYKDCPHMDISTAEALEQRIINIPSSACFGDDDN